MCWPACNVQKLTAYFTSKIPNLAIAKPHGPEVTDRFQTPAACDFVQLEEMPLTDAGEIDRARLVALDSTAPRSAGKYVLEDREWPLVSRDAPCPTQEESILIPLPLCVLRKILQEYTLSLLMRPPHPL